VPKDQTHSKLLADAARETLAPLGVFQNGRSRLWIDDRGWWITLVQFQPSSWSKGSYLNVGAMWLWYEKNFFSFDYGHRVAAHVQYLNREQFRPEALRLAASARDEVIKLRNRFSSVRDAAHCLLQKADSTPSLWDRFHAGAALGYVEDIQQARRCFEEIIKRKATDEWETTLQETARCLSNALGDPPAFKRRLRQTILRTRMLHKLPERKEVGL
jgi:hypothetical protein